MSWIRDLLELDCLHSLIIRFLLRTERSSPRVNDMRSAQIELMRYYITLALFRMIFSISTKTILK